MRVPYERWLKCLVQFQGMTISEAILVADSYGFIPPTTETLTFVRMELARGRPKPFKVESSEAIRWIRDNGLWAMHVETNHVTSARAILGQLQLRRVVEFLLAANTPHATVAEYAKDVLGVEIDAAAVQSYEHYFWDVNALTQRQWVAYFKQEFRAERKEQASNGVRAKDMTVPIMAQTSKKLLDCMRMRSPEYALWQLGHRVELGRDQVLRSMFHEAAMRFTETSLMSNSLHTAQTAKLWTEVVMSTDDKLAGSGDQTQQLLDELRGIRIRTKESKVSSIEELRGET